MAENTNQSTCFIKSATEFFTYNSSTLEFFENVYDNISDIGSGEDVQNEIQVFFTNSTTFIILSMVILLLSTTFGLLGKQLWSIGLIFYGFLGAVAITGTLVPSKYYESSCVESTSFVILVSATTGLLVNWIFTRLPWLNAVFFGSLFSYGILEIFPESSINFQIGDNFLNRSIFPGWAIILGSGVVSTGILRNFKNSKSLSSAALGAWGVSSSIVSILQISSFPIPIWIDSIIFYILMISFYTIQTYVANRMESTIQVNDSTIILPS